ncbi:MAG: methyl-accepting chemotaxis protein [Prochlorotrichaceae cyanobacterium]
MLQQTQSWKLRYWILTGYAIPVIALLISAVITYINVRIARSNVAEVDRSAEVSFDLANVEIGVQTMSRATRGYLLDPSNVSEETFNQSVQNYEQLLEEVQPQIVNPEQQQRFEKLKVAIKELEDINRLLINTAKEDVAKPGGTSKRAVDLWKKDGGRAEAETVTNLFGEIQTAQEAIVTENQAAQNASLENLRNVSVAAAIFSTLASSFFGLWIVGRTSRQMNDSASAIASSTSEIAATVEQQERTAQQQAASVNETTTTMDELGASSRQSAEQAAAAAAGAKQALELAEGGTRAVDRTLTGMGTLREKVGAIADQIMRLSEQTSQIGSISGLVSDLANQTNMLALNAAVEAVRAGEHGKGFAVVSGEIRKLADQSKKSAEKINALVQDIQNAINSTVMATDEGTKTVEEGVRIAEETAQAFAGVTDAVNNVVLNSQQISLNVKQQAVAIQQVVSAMNNLNAAANETANGIGQVKIGTQRLNSAAGQLQGLV